jgi:hypothetical protein
MEDAAAAHRYAESGQKQGSVVVDMRLRIARG